MFATATVAPFLNLPPSVRSKTYTYLLSPLPDEGVTTINYALDWPHLEDASNTTLAGRKQIDFCTCQQKGTAIYSHQDEAHTYTHYQCTGPNVNFTSPSLRLWLLQTAHGRVNILRPASETELETRPRVAILRCSKQIYEEAHPLLYRNRAFMFLTGPCPRGRYQAYATLQWLKALSSQARNSVESLCLLLQPYEEDCSPAEVEQSYTELAVYIRDRLPSFKQLCLEVSDQESYRAVNAFVLLFEIQGTCIRVRKRWATFADGTFASVERFLDSFPAEQTDGRKT